MVMILALAAGAWLLLGSVVAGLFPLVGGSEECSTRAPSSLGESGLDAIVTVSPFPFGASCAFNSVSGEVFHQGPSILWTIGIVVGLLLIGVAIIGLWKASAARSATRLRSPQ